MSDAATIQPATIVITSFPASWNAAAEYVPVRPITLLAGADHLLTGCADLTDAAFDSAFFDWYGELPRAAWDVMGVPMMLDDVTVPDRSDEEPEYSNDPQHDDTAWLAWEAGCEDEMAYEHKLWRDGLLAAVRRAMPVLCAMVSAPWVAA